MVTQHSPIRRALISVSDKTGLAEFAKGLAARGVEIYSTGGTYRFLADHGIVALEVAQYTGFPEVMDGRVKTLHPKSSAGFLPAGITKRIWAHFRRMRSRRSTWSSSICILSRQR